MSQSFQFHITAAEAGRRLDEFLAARFASLSRIRISNLINAGACTINQSVTPSGWRLAAGDLVEVTLSDAAPTAMEPEAIPLEVLYEDAHLIVIVKPAGLLVHPTMSVKRGTLANALTYHVNREFYGDEKTRLVMPAHGEAHTLIRPGLVHRLDRATSGLLVVAKTAHALSQLSGHFRRRLIEKRYLALITGRLEAEAGEINAPIGRDQARRPVWWITSNGKPAVTRFTVRERFAQATLVELEPVTGRTNQLRIHLAYSGHAIVGDELYGDAARPSFEFKTDDAEGLPPTIGADELATSVAASPRPRVAASRLCLHAWRLGFHHPAHNQWLEFTAPLPPDFVVWVDDNR